ncbi:hypothetical protein OGAPHI_003417 [Ogataea philodendri]|uniref:Ubiquitin-like 1-activating enzyme E1A n=1 Tax=Ogataea philodendri TaxID=1378263 RepID=A0A9P8P7Z8_9ASCO|nr:uncharacterized protein OGAPHI_003417 [Ogataea philodendri]KAH3666967.1 hypothetical protein OGAPHI_003417 [Ogataea philodendri]
MEAQTRMRGSRVLVVNLTSVGGEVVKNLMLGGIGAITVIDSTKVLDQDLNVNFFFDKTQVSEYKVVAAESRIRELNPRVNLSISTDDWESKDTDYFASFNLIVATGLDKDQLSKFNTITRDLNIPFYAAGSHGLYGYIFVDLIEHESSVKYERNPVPKKLGVLNPVAEIVRITDTVENDVEIQNCIVKTKFNPFSSILVNTTNKFAPYFPTPRKLRKITPVLPILLALFEYAAVLGKPIEEVHIEPSDLQAKVVRVIADLQLPKEILDTNLVKKLANQAFCEFQPVSAILGGALSQDVINMLGRRELPLNNFVVLDGYNNEMPVFNL